ncbi:metalloregulator ArsR/SmtB family transcription factor [Lactococcus formosensis subsp. formosensis]|uniref:ArsR/SmtB family transcription factor n=1 Tax=Lactococcus formosensis TaxID=1281486 RepID=UPI0007CBA0E3|nr:metalloregulator ArsR/SmtB family transcription factor [Lactococcus formosensis]NHI66796.1 ArsR family transcriptional regulator [Lactococcus garvieae]MDT2725728.1 metalloregulator ArsR/SmtB family transcription factor [Lactococcus formosensis]BAV02375.1 HTH-type transcriptional regulator [Lactococcus formosensis]BDW48689.1 transcriptional regulator [Lactococcus formosensis]BDX24274.1 transcriptional regulator [Lactococcus formosensis]
MKFEHLKHELSEVGDFLIALGDEKRQAIIIKLLEESDCKGIQVGDLIEATGLSRPAISHHLKILRQAKIVNYRSEGTKNFYYLEHDTSEIIKLQHFLDEVTRIMKGKQEK